MCSAILLLFALVRATSVLGEETDPLVSKVQAAVSAYLSTSLIDNGNARVSPDGELVAYAVSKDAHLSAVYVRPIGAAGRGTQIATDAVWPTWSPDGSRLALMVKKNGLLHLSIWTREDASLHTVDDFEIVARFWDNEATRPQWTADGQKIVFVGAPLWGSVLTKGINPWGVAVGYAANIQANGMRILTGRPDEVMAPERAWESESTPEQRIYGYQRLCVYDLSSHTTRWFPLPGLYHMKFAIDPNGKRVALQLTSAEVTHSLTAPSEPAENRADIYVLDLERDFVVCGNPDQDYRDSEVRCGPLASPILMSEPGATNTGMVSWSPDGHRVAFLSNGATAPNDVTVYDIATRSRVVVTRSFTAMKEESAIPVGERDGGFRIKGIVDFQWLPEQLGLLVLNTVKHNSREGWQVWRVPPTGSARTLLHTDGVLRFSDILSDSHHDRVSDLGRDVAVVLEHRNLLASFNREAEGSSGYMLIDLKSGKHRILAEQAGLSIPARDDFSQYRNGSVYFLGETRSTPLDLYRFKLQDRSIERVLNLNSPRVPYLGKRLNWATEDGAQAGGNLFLPASENSASKPPLVALVYADDHVSAQLLTRYEFSHASVFAPGLAETLLSLGFAVYEPEIPMPRAGEPMRQIVANTELAIAAVKETGLIDVNHIGVAGHSFGGYTVNCLVTQTNLFQAAVSASGLSDTFSYYFLHAKNASKSGGQEKLPAPLWDHPDVWMRNSPIIYAPNVNTPMLLLHGGRDNNLPPEQSILLYNGLVALDKPVEIVIYPEEGHTANTAEATRHSLEVTALFFEHYLKTTAQAALAN